MQFDLKSRRLCSQKAVVGIGIDDIGNLDDWLRVVLIDEECGILKVVIDGGELAKNINQKKTSDVLQAFRSPINVVNQIGKHVFFCG